MSALMYFTKKLHHFAGKILYINLFGMMIISFLEGIGILLLIPMLSLIGIFPIGEGGLPFLNWFQGLQDVSRTGALLSLLGVYVLLLVGQGLIKRNLSLRDTRIHMGFINYIRQGIYQSLLQANWDFFVKRRKSDMVNALTHELAQVTNGTKLFLQILSTAVFTLIQIGIALWLSPVLTLLVMLCGGGLSLFSSRFIRKSKSLGDKTTQLAKQYISGITDHFNGIKDIKSNMLEPSRLHWLERWNSDIAVERMEHAKVSTYSQFLYKGVSAVMIACFVFVSVEVFQFEGQQLLLITVIFARLWPQFTTMQSHLEQIAAMLPAFKSLLSLQEQSEQAREVAQIKRYTEAQFVHIEQGLECRGVSFRYNKAEERFALRDVDIQIPARRLTAIVGHSGAGKSTLIDILMGLMQPDQGDVLVDGKPLDASNMLALRRSISYVPQDPFLFNASIRENLLLIESSASDEDLWEALTFAAADGFVRQLPQGLDTIVGDRGVRLSGGERQRLVLARAILRKPSLLILDEATSALDAENEANIQASLERMSGTMTIVVIAHRLSTIRNADQVMVLEHGRIVQQGRYHELAQEAGLFKRLLEHQRETVESAS